MCAWYNNNSILRISTPMKVKCTVVDVVEPENKGTQNKYSVISKTNEKNCG